MKVYLIYYKKELYAFTTVKDMYKKFMSQRNPKCFIAIKKDITEKEFKSFSYIYQTQMLTEIPLSISVSDYTFIVATYSESEKLNYEADQLDIKMSDIYIHLCMQTNIKNKYIKSIKYLTQTNFYVPNKDDTKDSISTMNQLALFSNLFKNTFIDNYEDNME